VAVLRPSWLWFGVSFGGSCFAGVLLILGVPYCQSVLDTQSNAFDSYHSTCHSSPIPPPATSPPSYTTSISPTPPLFPIQRLGFIKGRVNLVHCF
jgi:hypothetical protein